MPAPARRSTQASRGDHASFCPRGRRFLRCSTRERSEAPAGIGVRASAVGKHLIVPLRLDVQNRCEDPAKTRGFSRRIVPRHFGSRCSSPGRSRNVGDSHEMPLRRPPRPSNRSRRPTICESFRVLDLQPGRRHTVRLVASVTPLPHHAFEIVLAAGGE